LYSIKKPVLLLVIAAMLASMVSIPKLNAHADDIFTETKVTPVVDNKVYQAGDVITVNFMLSYENGTSRNYDGFSVNYSTSPALEYVSTDVSGMIAEALGNVKTSDGNVSAGNTTHTAGSTAITTTGALFSVTFRVPDGTADGTEIHITSHSASYGMFYCATNGWTPTSDSQSFVTGISSPKITENMSSAKYTQGDTASPLSVSASVQDGGTLSYQWYSCQYGLNSGGAVKGAVGASYTPSTKAANDYRVYCIVTNTAGGLTVSKQTSTVSIDVYGSPLTFEDVPDGAWYYNPVKYVHDRGLMTGYTDTVFGPGDSVSRSQFVTILYRIENEPDVTYTDQFDDVAEGFFYSKAVIWAYENKIVSGYNEHQFGTSDEITREQMAKMLYRYAQYKNVDVSADSSALLPYPDASNVSSFAMTPVSWMIGKGYIKGDSGYIHPQKSASRAECATILQRFLSSFEGVG